MILLTISISMFTLQRYYINSKSYITVTGKASRARELIDTKFATITSSLILITLSICVIGMYILIPISSFNKIIWYR